jgi:hypothetical protein
VHRQPNTQAVRRLAAEKSEKARERTRKAMQRLQQQGTPINFSRVCETAHVSKTFLYDPGHADLAEEIRRLREQPTQKLTTPQAPQGKSAHAKDVQIARFKERVHQLEQRINALQQENELLYGNLAALPGRM